MKTDHRSRIGSVPRRAAVFSVGYSLFVKITKIVLPLAALVIVGLIILRLNAPQQQKIADFTKTEETQPGQVDLILGRYEGVDAKGRAYLLSAARASRNDAEPDVVQLVQPAAEITLEDKVKISVAAQSGKYDYKQENLVLSGGVTITHGIQHKLHLEDISLDLKAETAHSDHSVRIESDFGTMQAVNMDVSDEGDLIVFGGPLTMTIHKL